MYKSFSFNVAIVTRIIIVICVVVVGILIYAIYNNLVVDPIPIKYSNEPIKPTQPNPTVVIAEIKDTATLEPPKTIVPTHPTPTSSPKPTTPTPKLTNTPSGLAVDFTDKYGVRMRLIPAGPFQMGSDSGANIERPVHTVYLDAFYIDIYEVTNALYATQCEFCASVAEEWVYFSNPAYVDHPVVISLKSWAENFCEFRGARLPTEAEWEKAARGGLEGKLYPWGDQYPDCSRVNYSGCKKGPVKVGSYPSNGYGLFDMAGNVWEWVSDDYSENFYSISPSENPTGPLSSAYSILRGGGWNVAAGLVRVSSRLIYNESMRLRIDKYGYGGFRCARSASD